MAGALQPEAPRGHLATSGAQKLRRGTSFYERDQVSIAASYEPSITRGRRRDNFKQKVRYLRERQRTLQIRETSTAQPQRARRARLIVHPHGPRKMAWAARAAAAIADGQPGGDGDHRPADVAPDRRDRLALLLLDVGVNLRTARLEKENLGLSNAAVRAGVLRHRSWLALDVVADAAAAALDASCGAPPA